MSNLDPKPAVVSIADPAPTSSGSLTPLAARRAPVGESTVVSRYLPSKGRPTVGAWCFLDYYGPDDVGSGPGMAVGPHPHTGLQTVTWLLEGDVVHRDSLGNVQAIHPGQLNLMTAGAGISHAETSPQPHPKWLHGLQLWVALPDAHRSVDPAFEHHAELPKVDLDGVEATILIGELAEARSPATSYSPIVGAQLSVGPGVRTALPLTGDFEHALLVVDGEIVVTGVPMDKGTCVSLGRSRRSVTISGETNGRAFLIGGEPFTEPLVMWWNFVGRDGDEVAEMRADWEAGRRFGTVVGAEQDRIPAPRLPPGRMVPRT